MFCKYCGKEIDDNTKYCSFCGKQIEETNRLSTLKIPHINKWGLYFYGLWFVPNFALLLIGGTAEYSSKALFPSAFYKWEDDFTLWTFGNNHIHTSYKYWQFDIDFYDITDFLFYTILIPFVLFLLYKIFSSLHKLFTKKRQSYKGQTIAKEVYGIFNTDTNAVSNKKNNTNTRLSIYLILCFLIPLIVGVIYHLLHK